MGTLGRFSGLPHGLRWPIGALKVDLWLISGASWDAPTPKNYAPVYTGARILKNRRSTLEWLLSSRFASLEIHWGPSGPLLGQSRNALGPLLGRSWALSGCSWAVLGRILALLGGLLALLDDPGALLGRSGDVPGLLLGCSWGATRLCQTSSSFWPGGMRGAFE